MTEYKHHVSGFFVKREEAQIALSKLIDRGLPPDQLRIYDNETAAREPAPQANSNTALKTPDRRRCRGCDITVIQQHGTQTLARRITLPTLWSHQHRAPVGRSATSNTDASNRAMRRDHV
jgi:hypothetical protein